MLIYAGVIACAPMFTGMRHEQVVKFAGKGNTEAMGMEPGDLIVVLKEQEHPTFRRSEMGE